MSFIRISVSIVLAVWPFFVCSAISLGQEKLKPGRLPSEVRKALRPGLLAEYWSKEARLLDSTSVRVPGIFLEENEPPTPFVQQRNEKISLSGYLKLKLKGRYQFTLVGNGRAKLSLNGNAVIAADGMLQDAKPGQVDLVKGYNEFEIEYYPPPAGQARLRVYWQNEGFEKEPVPSVLLLHSPAVGITRNGKESSEISVHEELHKGRELVLRHNCLKCHQVENLDGLYQKRDTPDLRIAASRVNQDWLEDWLMNPGRMRNDISMPSMFDGEESKQTVGDLAAFLMSLSKTDGGSQPVGDAEKGADLFENIGCIGCHHFEKPDFDDEYQRISLFYTGSKFQTGKLAEFLSDSRAHYQWSRMPKFRLTGKESEDLESFIRSESKGQTTGIDGLTKDVSNGKQVFQSIGCANCHTNIVAQQEFFAVKPLAELSAGKGCLAPPEVNKPDQSIPDFGFVDEQRSALNQLIKADVESSFSTVNHAYFAATQIKTLRCATCHDLDDEQATLPYIIEEEGAVGLAPNRVPMLTYAGEKLLVEWSEKLLTGQLPYRVREHFRVQMPGFPMRGKIIAQGLSQMHGFEGGENSSWTPKAEEIAKGQRVAAMETGLSCNRCHAIADKKPNAAFDAQSTNLIYAAQRLRKEYYMRWMFDPLRIDKQTKMPRFSEDRMSTSLKAVADGDAKVQFEALWQYLNSLKPKE